MSIHTRSQKLAQAAFARIAARGAPSKEYANFAIRFPTLIHACGLAQAVAFALAKKETAYVKDLAAVLKDSGHGEIASADALNSEARTQTLGGYLRLSRDALRAASWLKRYVEAAGENK
jgi:CRISPR-associated protein Cmr5